MESAFTPIACRFTPVFIALAAVLGCGCSSHLDDHLYGRFEAGTVVGLRYTTPSGTGLTGADGTFTYHQGETVTFSIGGITLGSAPGAQTISPFTLAGVEAPTTEAGVRAGFGAVFGRNAEMARVMKITTLLLSLDIDGDPDNGIDLTGRDTGLMPASLDFDLDLSTFIDAVERLADDTNVNIPFNYPARYLFGKLGITVRAHAYLGQAFDLNGDGAAEFIESRSYNPDGSVVLSFDSDADGNHESDDTTVLGPMGREVSHRLVFDNDDDGVLDYIQTTTTTYDAHGRTLLSETKIDANGDGVIDHSNRTVYTLADNGQISTWVYENDIDLDGVTDQRHSGTFTYDDRRRPAATYMEFDDDGDGAVEFREKSTNTYNAADQVTMQAFEDDMDGDGVYDRRFVLQNTYDDANDWIAQDAVTDLGNDGTVDSSSEYAAMYDESGNRISNVSTFEQVSPASRRTYSTVSTFDAFHEPLTVIDETDSDGDGTFDLRTTVTITYDPDGRELSNVNAVDAGANGSVDQNTVTTTTYGSDGQFLESIAASDSNADGTTDRTSIITKTYTLVDDGVAALAYEYFQFGSL